MISPPSSTYQLGLQEAEMLVSAYEWEASSLQKLSLSSPPRQRGASRMEGGQVEQGLSPELDFPAEKWGRGPRRAPPPCPHNQAHGDVCFTGRSGAEWVPSTRPQWLGASLLFPRQSFCKLILHVRPTEGIFFFNADSWVPPTYIQIPLVQSYI